MTMAILSLLGVIKTSSNFGECARLLHCFFLLRRYPPSLIPYRAGYVMSGVDSWVRPFAIRTPARPHLHLRSMSELSSVFQITIIRPYVVD